MSKRDEILEAALVKFADKGYCVTLADISEEVGLKVPSLYSHFKSKEQIFYLVIENEINSYFQYLDHLLIETHGLEETKSRLEMILYGVLKYFENPCKLRFWKNMPLISQEGLKQYSRQLIHYKEVNHTRRMRILFERGIGRKEIQAGDLDGYIGLYFAMIQGILDTMLFINYDEEHLKAFVDSTWKTYWSGIMVK